MGPPSDEPTVGLRIATAKTIAADATATADAAATSPSAPPVRTLPTIAPENYARGEPLAQGGMGRICTARDLRLDRDVAIKEVLEPSGSLARRFEREALITARLQHPSIVTIYEAGRWPSGEPFYAMRLVQGRALKHVLAAATTFDARLALVPHLLAVADAIAYAHEQRIIHRDLKPANILVGDFGETVVIDWGLAKDLAADEGDDAPPETRSSDAALTTAGSVMGTPGYMPPEQARGTAVDERADVYAIGALLYHLLAGQPPFTGTDSAKVLEAVANQAPQPLGEREPRIAPDLLAIVDRAMARAPAGRYPTARELADDLRRFQTGQLVASHRYTRVQLVRRFIRRHRVPIAVGSLAALALAITGAVSIQRIRAERDTADAQRRRADAAQRASEQARTAAIASRDEAIIQSAAALVKTDPGRAIEALESLSPGTSQLARARLIAADARTARVPLAAPGFRDATRLEVSPDHQQFVTGSGDGKILLWRMPGLDAHELGRHDGDIQGLAWAPDGKRVASVSLDRTARIWSTDGRLVARFPHPAAVLQVAYAPDGRSIATLSGDDVLRVWDVARGTLIASGPMMEFSSIQFADAHRVVGIENYSNEPGELPTSRARVLDARTGRVTTLAEHVRCADQQGPHLVIASDRDRLRLWDFRTDRVVDLPAVPDAEAVAVAADGTVVVSASAPRHLVRMDVVGGRSTPLGAATSYVNAIALSPDHAGLAVEADGLSLWDVASGDRDPVSAIPGRGVQFVGPYVADLADSLRLWPAAGDEHAIAAPRDARQVLILRDGRRAVVGASGEITVAGRPPLRLPAAVLGEVALSPVRDEVAAVGADGTVRTLDLGSGELRTLAGTFDAKPLGTPETPKLTFPTDHGVSMYIDRVARSDRNPAGWVAVVRFSPDGKLLVAGDATSATMHVWTLATGAHTTFDAGGTVEDFAITPDGRSVLVARTDGALRVHPLAGGGDRTFTGHRGPIEQVVVRPDGRQAATASEDHTVRVWDLASGRTVAELDRSTVPLAALAYGPGGRLLVIGGTSGHVDVWRPADRTLVAAFSVGGVVLTIVPSPDGATVAVGSTWGLFQAQLATGAVRTLRGRPIGDVVFSSDGTQIAAVAEDGIARWWSDDLPRDEAGLRAWMRRLRPPPAGTAARP